MLKALELCGFKSFADKTRFEFPDGITVIVGPNGSGKSNLVDAIKWVLGSQSAKSLRGKDMADVIFKGTSGRKAVNTAEATIVFENSDGRLPIDAPEVHVTRRVYRSGEGEYLINRQPCRLKDVRDLFRGTGAGTEAYSLIEQGKVDSLLQASARDRRAIFEEAAGISRFKSKKVEAQRRLERVEQNLLRLSDIVDEVENRLRSVRAQAGKARRYREYSDRLQQLRTHVALTDWEKLSGRLAAADQQHRQWADDVNSLSAQCTAEEARALEDETAMLAASTAIRDGEQRLARNHEEIGTRQSRIGLERSRVAELDDEAARYRARLTALSGRIGDVVEQLETTRDALVTAEQDATEIRAQLGKHERDAEQLRESINSWQQEQRGLAGQHIEAMTAIADMRSRMGAVQAELAGCDTDIDQADRQLTEVCDQLKSQQEELAGARRREEELVSAAKQLDKALAVLHQQLDDQERLIARRRDELSAQQARRLGLEQRAALLEELESRREGLTAGVREVLEIKSDAQHPHAAAIVGLVADVLRVETRWAPLVDAALGPVAQHVILRDAAMLRDITERRFRPRGRVGFMVLDAAQMAPQFARPTAFADNPAVLGCLADLVQTDTLYQSLVQRLLGRSWAVRDLRDAFTLNQTGQHGLQLVTMAGEVIEPAGVVIAGPKEAVALVSRRSQLRELNSELAVLASVIAEATAELARLQENIERQQLVVRHHEDERDGLAAELSECRVKIAASSRYTRELATRRATLEQQQQRHQQRRQQAQTILRQVGTQIDQKQQAISDLAARTEATTAKIAVAEQQWQTHQHAVTRDQVKRARCEQRLDALRLQLQRFEEDQRERDNSLTEAQTQLAHIALRIQSTERSMLTATSELAMLYLQKEQLACSIIQQTNLHQQLLAHRDTSAQRMRELRDQHDAANNKQHECALEVRQLESERSALADRLRDDYGIEISELENSATGQDVAERSAIETEIAALRRKISNIGAVNMEALTELDELESRYGQLSGQLNDLTDAKESLQRIIQKINADSRRLFTETLEAIRANFRALYRRTFGGGKADLVLEENVDVLEAGIEIMATPPGKPSFNNSLLSGGERALTAVALLLAIFQYRPSPFCVLDEVDAPFDEANIERFVDVLKDFLQWTKFVLVTHSKKTMTAATTLYGITMQESGVSKQVAVRFEDVTDDGEIRVDGAAPAGTETPGDEDERGAA